MIEKNYKYSIETGKIIGLAMEVHKDLGNGFQEVIYQRALEIEFARNNIPFKREFEMPIIYRNEQIGTRRVDFFSVRQNFSWIKSNNKFGAGTFCAGNKLFGGLQFRDRTTFEFWFSELRNKEIAQ